MSRKKKVVLPPQPPKANLEVGDKVRLVLDYHIATHQENEYLLKFWESINGKTGVVTRIKGDDEVWVVGGRTAQERMFTAYTLEKIGG